jgi:aspartyl-tRNA(Asn)/glutamyl-tRNA(Gln) amidotransferase subunit A
MTEDIAFASVRDLSRLLQSGELSPVELLQIYLDRADELDVPDYELPSEPRPDHGGKLATMITIAREKGLRQAEAAEREITAGEIRGPLHGIPYGVKDILDTASVRTTWGSPLFMDRVPERDATVVTKLEEAGAVLMAKMSMGEFAGGNTSNALNPWKLDRTTFGSSSGTVTAAIAGLIGFGIGTETGGSIVFPASAVGATGLRPTFGRVSRFGCMALSWSLDKIGPGCRTADDCGLVLEAIAGHDPKDNSTRRDEFRFEPRPERARELRIGISRAELDMLRAPTNREVFSTALDAMTELSAGAEDVVLPNGPIGAVFSVIVGTEGGASFKHLFEDRSVLNMFEYNRTRRAGWKAASIAPAEDYLLAQRVRQDLTRKLDALFEKVDVLIAPTWPSGAALREVEDGWPVPAHPDLEPVEDEPVPRLNYLANLGGLPGIAVPCGFDDDGVPLSLQLVGKAWDEAAILDLALAYQSVTDWHQRRPPVPYRV